MNIRFTPETSERILYIFFVSLIITVILSGYYLPMTDMPQHAGQVVAINDLLKHDSPWQNMLSVNYTTPYMTCYFVWLMLYQVFDIVTASRIMVALIFLLWVIAWVCLRRAFQGTKTVDWVILPSFFGFPYVWGFMPYLASLPVMLFFLLANKKWADNDFSLHGGIGVCLFGIFLFFSHVLGYGFGCLLSYIYILFKARNPKKILYASWPYLIFALLLIQYLLRQDPLVAYYHYGDKKIVFDSAAIRIYSLLKYALSYPDNVFGIPNSLNDARVFSSNVYISMLLIIYPLIFMHLSKNILRYIPFIGFLLVWFLLPHFMNNIFFLYERYSVFFFGTYFLIFDYGSLNISLKKSYLYLSLIMIILFPLGQDFLNIMVIKNNSLPLQQVLAAAPEKKRIVYLNYNPLEQMAYIHAGSWYQAEKHGWSDFNFAWFSPAVVRYRPESIPAVKPKMETNPDSIIHVLDCNKNPYDLLLLHISAPATQFKNFGEDLCSGQYTLIKQAGEWGLYEYQKH